MCCGQESKRREASAVVVIETGVDACAGTGLADIRTYFSGVAPHRDTTMRTMQGSENVGGAAKDQAREPRKNRAACVIRKEREQLVREGDALIELDFGEGRHVPFKDIRLGRMSGPKIERSSTSRPCQFTASSFRIVTGGMSGIHGPFDESVEKTPMDTKEKSISVSSPQASGKVRESRLLNDASMANLRRDGCISEHSDMSHAGPEHPHIGLSCNTSIDTEEFVPRLAPRRVIHGLRLRDNGHRYCLQDGEGSRRSSEERPKVRVGEAKGERTDARSVCEDEVDDRVVRAGIAAVDVNGKRLCAAPYDPALHELLNARVPALGMEVEEEVSRARQCSVRCRANARRPVRPDEGLPWKAGDPRVRYRERL
ncbi:hypothetical protein DFH09DRAFT_1114068 [Mycena vulgaris]|nr:hypothetical protein DFH09DRAFT_1114068 [Mycena vulgaris]